VHLRQSGDIGQEPNRWSIPTDVIAFSKACNSKSDLKSVGVTLEVLASYDTGMVLLTDHLDFDYEAIF
jgi:hypothetical protein